MYYLGNMGFSKFVYWLITVQETPLQSKNTLTFAALLFDILLVGVFFNQVLPNIQKLSAKLWFFASSLVACDESKVCDDENNKKLDSELCNNQQQPGCPSDMVDHENNLYREDVEMVMGKLGLFCSSDSEKLKDQIGSDELSQLFDDKEPSLEELKDAFDVFDHNKDGFIDGEELQRVLSRLGLKEGFDLQSCRRMIRTFDENGDGRIDFNEFVKFMESSFC